VCNKLALGHTRVTTGQITGITQQQKSHKINVSLNKQMKKNVLPLKRGCRRGERHPTTVKRGCRRGDHHQTTLKKDAPTTTTNAAEKGCGEPERQSLQRTQKRMWRTRTNLNSHSKTPKY